MTSSEIPDHWSQVPAPGPLTDAQRATWIGWLTREASEARSFADRLDVEIARLLAEPSDAARTAMNQPRRTR